LTSDQEIPPTNCLNTSSEERETTSRPRLSTRNLCLGFFCSMAPPDRLEL
jgi:hypothetical protein